VGKKELSIQGRRDSFVLGELFTVVRRERLPEWLRARYGLGLHP
jgi:hypothetical protein